MTLVRIYIILLSMLPISGMAQSSAISSPGLISPQPSNRQFSVLPPAPAPVIQAPKVVLPPAKYADVMKKKKKAKAAPVAAPVAQPTVVVVQVPTPVAPVAPPVPLVQATPKPAPTPKEDIYKKDMAPLMDRVSERDLGRRAQPAPQVIYRTSRSSRTYTNLGKNGVSTEGAGRGGYYSVNYDRMTGTHVALGLGFSYINLKANDEKNTPLQFVMAPIYGNFYFLGNEHRPFFTIGATILSVSGEIEKGGEVEKILFERLGEGFNGIAAIPSAGLGYEFRGSSGFMTRITAYAAYINKEVLPWGGVSIGTAF